MDNQAKKKGANRFAAAFAQAFAETLAARTGAPFALEVMAAPVAPTSKGTPIHFRLTVKGALNGECFVEFNEPQASELVAKIAEDAAGADAEQDEPLAKVLAAATTGLAQSLAPRYGELTFKVERVAGLAFGGMFVVPLARAEEPSSAQMLLYFGGQLLEGLSEGAEAEPAAVSANNLRLVMDVELNVSLRFGQRQMPLREVLELTNGSVVELDRMVDEPVELYLDGKLIARGEAVVVDGNYGLRVTEIPQPVASHFLN